MYEIKFQAFHWPFKTKNPHLWQVHSTNVVFKPNQLTLLCVWVCVCVCEVSAVSAVGKISDCQPEGPGFYPRPGRGLNFGRSFFPHRPWEGVALYRIVLYCILTVC